VHCVARRAAHAAQSAEIGGIGKIFFSEDVRDNDFEGKTREADTRLSIEFPLSRARACFGGACGVDGHRDRAVRA
jgi:hypothetical protein